ncbi:DoxX family protein [Paraburkholderia sediminicola]
MLLVFLFVTSGWSKLTGFSATVSYMAQTGAPIPALSAVLAVVVEFVVGISILVGFYTRPLAVILALHTVVTAVIAHHFWTMSGMERTLNMINFYKNISIAGGLLMLAMNGPGKYSIDKG